MHFENIFILWKLDPYWFKSMLESSLHNKSALIPIIAYTEQTDDKPLPEPGLA